VDYQPASQVRVVAGVSGECFTLIAGIVFLPFIMWAERALKFRYLNPDEQS
jgi:hypothetical protein